MKRRRHPDYAAEIEKLVLRIYKWRMRGDFERAKLLDEKLAGIQKIANKKITRYGQY